MNRWTLAAGMAAALALAACRDDKPDAPASLESMVDAVMPRLQVLAGLRLNGEVKMEMQSRDSLRRYIESRMTEEMPAAELEGIRATYVALGLLPDTLDLRQLLLDLYTEQVVGYYDPDTKKLYVVEGVPDEALQPVLVHELVHALQDQYTNLDSLIAPERGNDRQTAAQAAIEGHATMVMFAYLAEQQTKSPIDPRALPNVAEEIRPMLEGQNSVLPVFQNSPRILRETLLFPYAGGAGFVQKLWIRPLESGFGDPYPAPLGERMPSSTEQVLHPDSRFMVQRDEPTELRIGPTPQKTIRDNTIGELEISVLLEEHLGVAARSTSQGWDGDRYRLVDMGGGKNALLWFSVWDDAGAADAFAAAYRRIAAKRGRTASVDRIEIDGRPGIRIIDPATPTLTSASVQVRKD